MNDSVSSDDSPQTADKSIPATCDAGICMLPQKMLSAKSSTKAMMQLNVRILAVVMAGGFSCSISVVRSLLQDATE